MSDPVTRAPLLAKDHIRLRALKEARTKVRRWENVVGLCELEPGLSAVSWRGWDRPAPDLSGCLAARDPDQPHLLAIWEPIPTHAPSPARVRPWCCYIQTVIFYDRYWAVRQFGRPWKRSASSWGWTTRGGFEVYDQVETRLAHDDVVSFDGDHWLVGGGAVRWHRGRWWMRRCARRIADVRTIGKAA